MKELRAYKTWAYDARLEADLQDAITDNDRARFKELMAWVEAHVDPSEVRFYYLRSAQTHALNLWAGEAV